MWIPTTCGSEMNLRAYKALLEKASPGPWMLWTSCSLRRIGTEYADGSIVHAQRETKGSARVTARIEDLEYLATFDPPSVRCIVAYLLTKMPSAITDELAASTRTILLAAERTTPGGWDLDEGEGGPTIQSEHSPILSATILHDGVADLSGRTEDFAFMVAINPRAMAPVLDAILAYSPAGNIAAA